MFVRKKKNSRGRVSIQILKKIDRVNKVIKTTGSSADSVEIDHLYHKVLHERPRLYGATFLDPTSEPKISELSNDSVRLICPELVFSRIFQHIGFDAI
jgi:hypothetical protein